MWTPSIGYTHIYIFSDCISHGPWRKLTHINGVIKKTLIMENYNYLQSCWLGLNEANKIVTRTSRQLHRAVITQGLKKKRKGAVEELQEGAVLQELSLWPRAAVNLWLGLFSSPTLQSWDCYS